MWRGRLRTCRRPPPLLLAVQARAAKRLLGGVASVLNGAAELRNARGTGHGRSGAPVVDSALARMAVGVVLPAVLYLIEIYEAPRRIHRPLWSVTRLPVPPY